MTACSAPRPFEFRPLPDAVISPGGALTVRAGGRVDTYQLRVGEWTVIPPNRNPDLTYILPLVNEEWPPRMIGSAAPPAAWEFPLVDIMARHTEPDGPADPEALSRWADMQRRCAEFTENRGIKFEIHHEPDTVWCGSEAEFRVNMQCFLNKLNEEK